MAVLRGNDGWVILLAWSEDVPGRGRFSPPPVVTARDDEDEDEDEMIIDANDTAGLFPPEIFSATANGVGDGSSTKSSAVLLLLHEPFRPCDDDKPRPLRDVMRVTVDGDLIVAPEITNCAERTIFAERYELVDGSWRQRSTPAGRGGPDGARGIPQPRRELFKTLRDELINHGEGDGVPRVRLASDLDAAEASAAAAAAAAERGRQRPARRRQSTNTVLMVSPSAFEANIQAAADNYFMADADTVDGNDAARRRVLQEYGGLVRTLVDVVGLRVHLFDHGDAHGTPDAVFPNNWFSTTQDGELVLYPMKTRNRRAERRPDIINHVKRLQTRALRLGATTTRGTTEAGAGRGGKKKREQREVVVVDMTDEERREPSPRILEGTGCLVLDNVNRVAYVSLSERADADLAAAWGARIGYSVVTFTARDGEGRPIYHTNVMMAVGTSAAVVCLEAVTDPGERLALTRSLSSTAHEVIEITLAQVSEMAGNALEVMDGARDLPVLCMSSRAYASLTPKQVSDMKRHWAGIHHAPIPTLETIGGGSVRCTMAELFV